MTNQKEKTEFFLKGWMSPDERKQLNSRYHHPLGYGKVGDVFDDLSYLRDVIVSKFLDYTTIGNRTYSYYGYRNFTEIEYKTLVYYERRLIEMARALLLDAASRLNPEEYSRGKLRKSIIRKPFDLWPNFYHSGEELIRIWMKSPYSVVCRILIHAALDMWSPEAMRFISHKLYEIEGMISHNGLRCI